MRAETHSGPVQGYILGSGWNRNLSRSIANAGELCRDVTETNPIPSASSGSVCGYACLLDVPDP
jgi:hypothetical protein